MFDLYHILAFFFAYSFLGWCVEVIYCTLDSGQLVNRGFLNGPYCPIYGFGMVGILLALEPVFDNGWLLFIGATAITSAIELFGGWALYKLFHARWWDYSDKPFNLGGYICAQFCLIWGVATLGVIKVVHPVVTLVVDLIPQFLQWPLVILFGLVMLLDTGVSTATAIGLNKQLKELDELNAALRRRSDTLSNIIGATAITMDQIKDEQQLQLLLAKAEAGDKLEAFRDELQRNAARRARAMEKLHPNHWFGAGRMLEAFPQLHHRDYQETLDRARAARKQYHREKK